MRHNFVNDIGDYAKYALLRALCTNGVDAIRLGVIWYLTEHVEHNGDGRKRAHLSQDGWECLDPELLDLMRQLEQTVNGPDALNLAMIERSGILPAGTVYFADALPRHRQPSTRVVERAAWFDRALQVVADCDIVFLDPDNGLEVRSVAPTSPLAGKYATTREIAALLRTGAGVVLYQHGNRAPWPHQRQRVCSQLAAAVDRPITIRSLRFGAFGVRAFFCIATSERTAELFDGGLHRLQRTTESWAKSSYLLFE